MRAVEDELRESPRVRALCAALAATGCDTALLLRFLRDLLGYRELLEFANRWAAARMLLDGRTQGAVAQELGMSTRTLSEIAQWVRGPFAAGGYRDVRRRLKGAATGSGAGRPWGAGREGSHDGLVLATAPASRFTERPRRSFAP